MKHQVSRLEKSEYPLYCVLLATLLVFSFYIYGTALYQPSSFLKDILCICALGATFMHILRHPPEWKLNCIDLLVGCLFIYLLVQLAYTSIRLSSFQGAYLGFRLDFIPIVLYFGFRRLKTERYQESLRRMFLYILLIGAAITFVEFVAMSSGFIGQDFFANLVRATEGRKEQSLGAVFRIYGIAGTPHITGIHHLLLLALLLYWPKQFFPGEAPAFFSWPRAISWLQIATVVAVMLSTSRTAWIILPIVLGLTILSQRRIRMAQVTIAGIALLGFFFLVIRQDREEREFIAQTFYGFRDNYGDYMIHSTEQVLRDSPVFGYGYEVAPNTIPQGVDLSLENSPLQSDIYFAEIFRMFGAIGLSLFAVAFLLIPLRLIFSTRCSDRGKGAALGVLIVGLATCHYSPLTTPSVSVATWYLMAMMSREWAKASQKTERLRWNRALPSVFEGLGTRGGIAGTESFNRSLEA